MTKLPTHSLLVPCYNAEAYIDGFLKNMAKLNRAFDEVLFYDDASADNTYQLLKDKGCTVIKANINSGPGYARNRLAEKATSQYIHFHDIDDEFNPDFLNMVNAKLATKATDVVLGYADWIDLTTRRPVIKWRYDQDEIITYPVGYFLSNPLGIINTVYKKEAFEKINGFNEQIKCWEDADLHVRFAASGASFAVIDNVIAYSLRHENGISNQQDKCWECRFMFLENYVKTLDAKHKLVLGIEFEKAAYNLFHYKKRNKAKKAFYYSRKCGHNAPVINNGILMRIKKVSPYWAFVLKASVAEIKRDF